jgi:hypothetical protein
MKTIADLIAVLQTLPQNAPVLHFEPNNPPSCILIHFGELKGVPTLWTEYDGEPLFEIGEPRPTVYEVEDLWEAMQSE